MAYKHLVSISLLAHYQSHNSLCKSQVLENALTHHIIAITQCWPDQTEMHSASLLLTHALSLSLFTIPLISSSGSHTDCHCSQAGSSTMTSAHKSGAERTFRISKGEREAEGVRMHLRNQRETETDRETGESFTVHHHSKS